MALADDRCGVAKIVRKPACALAGLTQKSSEILYLAERFKQQQVLHADETPVKQLDPGAGKTKRAYLWRYRSNDLDEGPPIVVFDYQSSRSGQHARDFLQGWQGSLLVDNYGG